MSSSTHSVGTSGPTRNVLSRLLLTVVERRAPGRRPSARKSPSTASAVASTPRAARGCGPTSASGRRPCVAVEVLPQRVRRPMRMSSRSSIVPSTGSRCGGAGRRQAAARRGHRLPLTGRVERPLAERGVHGEDLAVADVADRTGLGDLVPDDGDGDVDVEDLAGRAYDRYCAVAQTHGRPVVPSMAEMAAPRPQPAEQEPAAGRSPRASPRATSGTGCGWRAGRGTSGNPSPADSRRPRHRPVSSEPLARPPARFGPGRSQRRPTPPRPPHTSTIAPTAPHRSHRSHRQRRRDLAAWAP